VPTPFQAPQANAIAEHWVRSVRHKCLDHLLFLNQSHLFLVSSNTRPDIFSHLLIKGIHQQAPIPFSSTQHL
jgi:putative transposase